MFKTKDLSVLAYANGFTMWHYDGVCADKTTIMGAGYFNDGSDMLRKGDRIIINSVHGSFDIQVAYISNDGTVTVADLGEIPDA